MKKFSLILCLALVMSILAGCAGTPVVYYSNCTCETVTPGEAATEAATEAAELPAVSDGQLLTGMTIATNVKKSESATAENAGKAEYDVTMVAVLVDGQGVIRDCIIDGIAATVSFGADGIITTDLNAAPQTKNELGENYNMVKFGKAIAEWDEQAAALAQFAIGKTLEELKNGAVDETGYAPEGTDLASSATIYLGGYVYAIEAAVQNAQALGAREGDSLKMATTIAIDGSKDASAEGNGTAQLDATVAVLTMNGDTISSCAIDAVQAKVTFDAAGVINSDIETPVKTKNELGPDYNMVAWGGAIAEWDEQAAAFAGYVTGKTVEEVQNIAVTETTKPADGTDLASSVTISIGGFQALIAKAAQ